MIPAIFLDKDGTVLQDVPYNADPDRMQFAPGARYGLALLAALRLPLFVVTNQPGIALEKFGFDALCAMRERLADMFDEAGASLAGFYFCPHHPHGTLPAYSGRCDCRKPAAGMLRRAAGRHGIDLAASWLVGDILDDIEAGRRAGCRTVLIDNGNETEWDISEMRLPDYRVPDLEAAGRLLTVRLAQHGVACP